MAIGTTLRNTVLAWAPFDLGLERKVHWLAQEYIQSSTIPGTHNHFSRATATTGLTLDQLVGLTDSYTATRQQGNGLGRAIKRMIPGSRLGLHEDLRREVAYTTRAVLNEMQAVGGNRFGASGGANYYYITPERLGQIISQSTKNKRVKSAVVGLFSDLRTPAPLGGMRSFNLSPSFIHSANDNMYTNWADRYLRPDDRLMSAAMDLSLIAAAYTGFGIGYAAGGLFTGIGMASSRVMVPRLVGGAVQGGSNALAAFGGNHGWNPYLVSGLRNFGYAAGMAALTGDATISTGLLLLKGAANTFGRGGVVSTLVDVGTDYGLMYNAYAGMPASVRNSISDAVGDIGPAISHAATSVYNWAEPGLKSMEPALQSLGAGISTFAGNELDYYFPGHENAGQMISQAAHDAGSAASDFWQGFQGTYSHIALPEIKNPFAGFDPSDIHIPQVDLCGVRSWLDNLEGQISCAYNNAVQDIGTFTSSLPHLGSGTPAAQYNPFCWDWDFLRIDFSGNYLSSH